MYNLLCQIVSNIFGYVLFIKIIETFQPRNVIRIWVLTHFELKTYKDFIY